MAATDVEKRSKHVNAWKLMAEIGFIFAVLDICQASSARVWPPHYTEDHLQLHKQVETHSHAHLEGFEIVVPSMTDENYNHVTHIVRHKRSNRVRREAIADIEFSDHFGLRYSFSGLGENFRVYLEPSNRLFTPTFSVKLMRNGSAEGDVAGDATNCHYRGWLTSHQGRPVAMSTCNGLTGLLRTQTDDVLLEPVPKYINHTFAAPMHPHIIYSRRHLQQGKHRLHYCGKNRPHPVSIPHDSQSSINLLSNGEVEIEKKFVMSRRFRRSVSTTMNRFQDALQSTVRKSRPVEKIVETMVVADRALIDNHNSDYYDVTTYVLTVMNMVSSLFLDHSLDGNLEFSLTELILLDDNSSLHLDHKADVSLNNFCKWQFKLNQSQEKTSDHSILITGIDICVHKNKPCETLGLAQIGGMCNKKHSCTINEDMGLGLAFTMAHETGHSFGMKHDGQANWCSQRDGYVMSPTLNSLNGVFTWSECSRETLSDFLRGKNSICLDNHPTIGGAVRQIDQLPGVLYSTDQQCKWQFGSGASLCRYRYTQNRGSLCHTLWCLTERSSMCETKYLPAAEGSSCGRNMWCRRGVCVETGSLGPRVEDGNWSDFGSWSSCTRTCGGGVQHRIRTCNNPTPKYGGRHCKGKDKLYRLCNFEKCPPSRIDFRSQQCAKFNSKAYRRKFFRWVPFTKYIRYGKDSCNLLCKAHGFGFFDLFADKVIDGTPCRDDAPDVCINGKCQHVGCDHLLGSNATYDACGVCNGGNASCSTIAGEFERGVNESGYYEVVRIPRGAYSVKIWERNCCTHSYIAVRNAFSPNKYYLNGNWNIDLSPRHRMAGVTWMYERKSFHKEYLYSTGHNPLVYDIIVEVLIISKNPGIRYSYSVRDDVDIVPPVSYDVMQFNWNVTYADCSSSCAGGIQRSFVVCMNIDRTVVVDANCDNTSKPLSSSRICNTQACPSRWITGTWKKCSRTCGGGIQQREVTCKKTTLAGEADMRDEDCDAGSKPLTFKTCQNEKCPAAWHTDPWSGCSRKCGRGKRKRRVYCQRGTKKVRQAACDITVKPRRKEKCVITSYCKRQFEWFVTDWEQCSSSCGVGVQRRKVKCRLLRSNGKHKIIGLRKCNKLPKPPVFLKKHCNKEPCSIFRDPLKSEVFTRTKRPISLRTTFDNNKLHWMAGGWQKCSMSCGGGVQKRIIKCMRSGETLPFSDCSEFIRPISRRHCNSYKCNLSASHTRDAVCIDSYPWCSLVPQHGQCKHKYFGAKCCKSCTN